MGKLVGYIKMHSESFKRYLMNALEKTIYALVQETRDIIRKIEGVFQDNPPKDQPDEPADNQSDND